MRLTWTLTILAGWILLIGPGVIEGKLFPAAEPAKLIRVEVDPTDPEWVVIDGTSSRLRPSCNPRRLDWYRGVRGGRDTVVEWDWGRPIVRDDGAFSFYSWRVRAAPPEVLTGETYADVIHQCKVLGVSLPWLTRSRFWN